MLKKNLKPPMLTIPEMVVNSNDDSVDDPVGTGGMIIAGVVESSEARHNNNKKRRREEEEEEKRQRFRMDAADTSALMEETNAFENGETVFVDKRKNNDGVFEEQEVGEGGEQGGAKETEVLDEAA